MAYTCSYHLLDTTMVEVHCVRYEQNYVTLSQSDSQPLVSSCPFVSLHINSALQFNPSVE